MESLKIGLSTDTQADYGPMITRAHLEKVKSYVDLALRKAPSSWSTVATSSWTGLRARPFHGGCLFDHVTPEIAHL